MSFPEDRPDGYDPDQSFDETTDDWYDPDSDIGTERQSHAGGRYQEALVIISDAGRVYYKPIP